MVTIPEKITTTIAAASHVVLATHVNPDGDALGSLFALTDILQSLGKKVFPYLEKPVSPMYDFLPDCDRAQVSHDAIQQFVKDAGDGNCISIALDSGDADRLGIAKDILLANSPFLVIDHHRGHRKFGDELWLESECSSTGEMVYELALQLGAKVSVNAAFCLYVALVTDTGSFRYENTSPRTLRIAADLLEIGVRPDQVAAGVYDNYTLARLRLMELVLATLEVHEDGKIGIICATDEMFQQSGAGREDVEGFINYPRSLSSVQVAAFIKKTEGDIVSVSLRAKGKVDVALIASGFGGGGHKNAAGFRFTDKTVDEVQATVLAAVKEALQK